MTGFHETLASVVEDDRARFSCEEFTAARLGAVAGSIRRRRAARSAGVGGAAVLGASVLAAGAINVPWGSLGVSGPGASPFVVCSTAPPDAAPAGVVAVPDGATWAVVDDATGAAFFVGLVDGHIVIWKSDGAEVPIEDATASSATLALPSGTTVLIEEDGVEAGLSLTPSDDSAVTIVGAHEYVDGLAADTGKLTVATVNGEGADAESETSPDGVTKSHDATSGETSWAVTAGGAVVAKVQLDGDVLVVDSPQEGVQRVEMSDDGGYHFRVNGDPVVMSFSDLGGEDIAVVVAYGIDYDPNAPAPTAAPSPSASPSVTCVTTTPEPSTSASPSASPSVSASASEAPTPSPSPTLGEFMGPEPSPFACGFEFPVAVYDSPGIAVSSHATTHAAVHDAFAAAYGDQPPTTWVDESQDLAYVGTVELANPEIRVSGPNQPLPQDDGRGVGATYVAVRDGAVVGVIVPPADNTLGITLDRDVEAGPFTSYFWDIGALTACADTTLEDADIYFVAGLAEAGGGYLYSWTRASD